MRTEAFTALVLAALLAGPVTPTMAQTANDRTETPTTPPPASAGHAPTEGEDKTAGNNLVTPNTPNGKPAPSSSGGAMYSKSQSRAMGGSSSGGHKSSSSSSSSSGGQ